MMFIHIKFHFDHMRVNFKYKNAYNKATVVNYKTLKKLGFNIPTSTVSAIKFEGR